MQNQPPSNPVFHSNDHVYFQRHANGDVEISKRPAGPGTSAEWIHVVTATIWPSVVATVSARGEGEGRYAVARYFHDNKFPNGEVIAVGPLAKDVFHHDVTPEKSHPEPAHLHQHGAKGHDHRDVKGHHDKKRHK
jgi:hypothetical protein